MMGAVVDFPRMTCPEDLLWAEPGAPEMPARNVEAFEPVPPRQFIAEPTDGGWIERWRWVAAFVVVFLCGFIVGEYAVLWSLVGRL